MILWDTEHPKIEVTHLDWILWHGFVAEIGAQSVLTGRQDAFQNGAPEVEGGGVAHPVLNQFSVFYVSTSLRDCVALGCSRRSSAEWRSTR